VIRREETYNKRQSETQSPPHTCDALGAQRVPRNGRFES
jgi:hypothetical protein